MARTGRPTKLSPEIQEKIIVAVRNGNYIETAAQFAGINKDTLYRWLHLGAQQDTGAYHDFSDALHKALAQSEMMDVATITRASADQWQAAAWRLERKFPDRWGRTVKVNFSVMTDGDLQSYITSLMQSPELNDTIKLIEEATTGNADAGSDGGEAEGTLPTEVDAEVNVLANGES